MDDREDIDVIRTLRAVKGLSQAELPADRKPLYKLEAGFSNISLEMLVQLAQTLKLEPSTLVVLLQSADNAASPDAILEKVKAALDEFEKTKALPWLSNNQRLKIGLFSILEPSICG